MSRQMTVTVTLSGTCPEAWDNVRSDALKARAEEVAETMARQIFKDLPGLIVAATATVEGGAND